MKTNITLPAQNMNLSLLKDIVLRKGGQNIVCKENKLKFESVWSGWVSLKLFSFFTEAEISINNEKCNTILTFWHNDTKWISYTVIVFFLLTALLSGAVIISIPISLLFALIFYLFLKIRNKFFLKKIAKSLISNISPLPHD